MAAARTHGFLGPDAQLYDIYYNKVPSPYANQIFDEFPDPTKFATWEQYEKSLLEWKVMCEQSLGRIQLPDLSDQDVYQATFNRTPTDDFFGATLVAPEPLPQNYRTPEEYATAVTHWKDIVGSALGPHHASFFQIEQPSTHPPVERRRRKQRADTRQSKPGVRAQSSSQIWQSFSFDTQESVRALFATALAHAMERNAHNTFPIPVVPRTHGIFPRLLNAKRRKDPRPRALQRLDLTPEMLRERQDCPSDIDGSPVVFPLPCYTAGPIDFARLKTDPQYLESLRELADQDLIYCRTDKYHSAFFPTTPEEVHSQHRFSFLRALCEGLPGSLPAALMNTPLYLDRFKDLLAESLPCGLDTAFQQALQHRMYRRQSSSAHHPFSSSFHGHRVRARRSSMLSISSSLHGAMAPSPPATPLTPSPPSPLLAIPSPPQSPASASASTHSDTDAAAPLNPALPDSAMRIYAQAEEPSHAPRAQTPAHTAEESEPSDGEHLDSQPHAQSHAQPQPHTSSLPFSGPVIGTATSSPNQGNPLVSNGPLSPGPPSPLLMRPRSRSLSCHAPPPLLSPFPLSPTHAHSHTHAHTHSPPSPPLALSPPLARAGVHPSMSVSVPARHPLTAISDDPFVASSPPDSEEAIAVLSHLTSGSGTGAGAGAGAQCMPLLHQLCARMDARVLVDVLRIMDRSVCELTHALTAHFVAQFLCIAPRSITEALLQQADQDPFLYTLLARCLTFFEAKPRNIFAWTAEKHHGLENPASCTSELHALVHSTLHAHALQTACQALRQLAPSLPPPSPTAARRAAGAPTAISASTPTAAATASLATTAAATAAPVASGPLSVNVSALSPSAGVTETSEAPVESPEESLSPRSECEAPQDAETTDVEFIGALPVFEEALEVHVQRVTAAIRTGPCAAPTLTPAAASGSLALPRRPSRTQGTPLTQLMRNIDSPRRGVSQTCLAALVVLITDPVFEPVQGFLVKDAGLIQSMRELACSKFPVAQESAESLYDVIAAHPPWCTAVSQVLLGHTASLIKDLTSLQPAPARAPSALEKLDLQFRAQTSKGALSPTLSLSPHSPLPSVARSTDTESSTAVDNVCLSGGGSASGLEALSPCPSPTVGNSVPASPVGSPRVSFVGSPPGSCVGTPVTSPLLRPKHSRLRGVHESATESHHGGSSRPYRLASLKAKWVGEILLHYINGTGARADYRLILSTRLFASLLRTLADRKAEGECMTLIAQLLEAIARKCQQLRIIEPFTSDARRRDRGALFAQDTVDALSIPLEDLSVLCDLIENTRPPHIARAVLLRCLRQIFKCANVFEAVRRHPGGTTLLGRLAALTQETQTDLNRNAWRALFQLVEYHAGNIDYLLSSNALAPFVTFASSHADNTRALNHALHFLRKLVLLPSASKPGVPEDAVRSYDRALKALSDYFIRRSFFKELERLHRMSSSTFAAPFQKLSQLYYVLSKSPNFSKFIRESSKKPRYDEMRHLYSMHLSRRRREDE